MFHFGFELGCFHVEFMNEIWRCCVLEYISKSEWKKHEIRGIDEVLRCRFVNEN